MSNSNQPVGNDLEEIVDNQGYLPAWWMTIFWGAFIWGFFYFIYLHAFYGVQSPKEKADAGVMQMTEELHKEALPELTSDGWTQHKMFQEELLTHYTEHPVAKAELNADGTNPFSGNAESISAGGDTFRNVCAACHGADAKGVIGPNLVDNVWLHGQAGAGGLDKTTDKILEARLFQVIALGVDGETVKIKQQPPKGQMPAHEYLGNREVLQVMAYLASINPSIVAK